MFGDEGMVRECERGDGDFEGEERRKGKEDESKYDVDDAAVAAERGNESTSSSSVVLVYESGGEGFRAGGSCFAGFTGFGESIGPGKEENVRASRPSE